MFVPTCHDMCRNKMQTYHTDTHTHTHTERERERGGSVYREEETREMEIEF